MLTQYIVFGSITVSLCRIFQSYLSVNKFKFGRLQLFGAERKTMKDETNKEDKNKQPPQEQFVQVAVVTTSGSFPQSDFERTPKHQKIRVILQKAADKLNITDTTDWIALVDDREINIEGNYLENNLDGQVEIDYGPREGGGGA